MKAQKIVYLRLDAELVDQAEKILPRENVKTVQKLILKLLEQALEAKKNQHGRMEGDTQIR